MIKLYLTFEFYYAICQPKIKNNQTKIKNLIYFK